jgi:hypothetical protein
MRIFYWLALALLPLIFGCYPKGAEYVEELDLVYTDYDDTFDFSTKRTYAIPDSVVKISDESFTDPDGDGKPQFVSSSYSTAILTAIKDNMAAYGWTLVDKNDDPDVILLPTATTTTYLFYYYDYWYWDWWYGGWYGWGWYYPGYYPPMVTGYRAGSVFVQMVDQKASRQTESLRVVWHSIFNGMAEGSSATIVSRIQANITQAFVQSPYLKH